MEKQKITIKQIADLAYVSRSVVSRVLNDHPNVSAEARQRVLRVIEEYNYRPSAVARSLATDRTYEICILAPRWKDEILASSYWSLIFLGLSEQCSKRGYYASLSMLSAEDGRSVPDRLISGHNFDGFVLIHKEVIEAVMPALRERSMPTVLIGHDASSSDVSSVDVDNYKGAYAATEHLLRLGHQRIALIIGRKSRQESIDRFKGYEKALSDAGLDVDDSLVVEGEYSQMHGKEAMEILLQRSRIPTAVFCSGDVLAEGVMLAAYKAGINVPDQLAVVGFDDLPSSAYTTPPLTTVRQPIYEKGVQAASLIIDRIEGKATEPVHIQLDPELIVRDSCGSQK